MGIFLKLAFGASILGTEMAEAAEGSGFGFSFNLLESNLFNLAIVYAILFYFGRGFLSQALGGRRSAIEVAIQEAEARKQEASVALADQQQKLSQAQTEATQIRASAEEGAKSAKAEILAKAEQDVQRMREAAVQDLNTEQERVITELRQRVVALALQKVESELPNRINDSTQQQLIDRSLAMLGGS